MLCAATGSSISQAYHNFSQVVSLSRSSDGPLNVGKEGEWKCTTPLAESTLTSNPTKWFRVTAGTSVREKRRHTKKYHRRRFFKNFHKDNKIVVEVKIA